MLRKLELMLKSFYCLRLFTKVACQNKWEHTERKALSTKQDNIVGNLEYGEDVGVNLIFA